MLCGGCKRKTTSDIGRQRVRVYEKEERRTGINGNFSCGGNPWWEFSGFSIDRDIPHLCARRPDKVFSMWSGIVTSVLFIVTQTLCCNTENRTVNLASSSSKVYSELYPFTFFYYSYMYFQMYENGNTCGSGDADDLVPMIMWVLCQSGMVSAEVEADYMWGLLLPSASSGEASYYLEAFHSAIHALKNLSPSPESSPGNSLDSVKPVFNNETKLTNI